MSHQEKQRIFDEYARLKGFSNWARMKIYHENRSMDYDEHIFAACDLVQEEQQKRINKVFCELINDDQLNSVYLDDCLKIKNLITNPENIIK